MEQFDLSLLTSLDALLQEGSVSRAAKRVGLSTPAMSHALARARTQLGDPLLVRAGRSMVLTPRAEAMKSRVHTLMTEARQLLSAERPFVAQTLTRTFVVHATDHALQILGVGFDRMLAEEAPHVDVRFVPNTPADASLLREGESDLAVGIYADLPPEMRTKQLFTDRLVCVVRAGHPSIDRRITLDEFARLAHIQVAPRGQPGGYVDDVLASRGVTRRVARAVPYFAIALELAASTDYVLTVSERLARTLGPRLGLRLLDPPISLRPYAVSLVWHPRYDGDAAHRFLRDTLSRAAKQTGEAIHEAPRSRLELKRSAPRKQRPRHR